MAEAQKDKWCADLEARLKKYDRENNVSRVLNEIKDIAEVKILKADDEVEKYIIVAAYADGVVLQSTYGCTPYFIRMHGDNYRYQLIRTDTYGQKDAGKKFSND